MRNLSLFIMVAFYIVAGIMHFIHPESYKKIIPPGLPNPGLMVFLSGICEITFAVLLIPVTTRCWAAWAIILLLIVILPANVQMMLNFYHRSNPWLWLTIVRLPLQLLLIYWAYQFTKK